SILRVLDTLGYRVGPGLQLPPFLPGHRSRPYAMDSSGTPPGTVIRDNGSVIHPCRQVVTVPQGGGQADDPVPLAFCPMLKVGQHLLEYPPSFAVCEVMYFVDHKEPELANDGFGILPEQK